MTSKFNRILLAGVGLSSLCAGSAALAQTAAPAAAADAATETGAIDEIVVTARRREEQLQDVPLAIQAFSNDTLEARRIENATDLSKIVPALTSAQSSRNEENYVIRAMSGSGASISGQQVTVPTYIAQVPLPIGDGGGPGRYYDLQNIQVLKGPQGTLFGRNSTGGAVLFEPKRPGSEFDGYVEGEFGNYGNHGIEGALNFPLSDSLMIRVAGKANDRDGFTQNITTNQDEDDRHFWTGRVSVLFAPTDSFENIFVADTLHSNTNGSSNHIAAVDPNATIPRLFAGAVQAQLARQQALGPYVSISDTIAKNELKASGFSNITTLELGENVTIKNILGYRRVKQLNRFDFDGTPLTLLNFDICQTAAACNPINRDEPWSLNVKQWSEELQLQGSAFDDRLTYTIGLFGSNTSTPDANYIHQTSVFGSTTDVNQFVRDRSRAIYGQATYDLSSMIEGLGITAGYRTTKDTRGLTIFQVSSFRCTTGTPGAAAPTPGNAPQCRAEFESKATSDSYTIGLDYKINDDALLYIAHRKGYRAGGTNPLAGPALLAVPPIPNAADLFVYQPETLKDVELGLKADFAAGDWDLRTNVALYHQKLKGAQLNQTFSVGTQTVSALVNASEAKVNGIETELTIAPSDAFNLLLAYAYTDAKYGSFLDYNRRDPVTQVPQRFTGRIIPFTPKHKFNVGASLDLPVPESAGEVTLSANLAHKSSIILGLVPFLAGSNAFDGESRQKATTVVDANLAWDGIGGTPIDATFFVTNLFDVTYKIGGASLINSGLGFNQRIYNEPRMYGVSLRYRFGASAN